ncbi:hypothetical protein XacyCFBP2565_22190 [Xanthomonas arboricola pv. corylina]|uniref:hypothetical protein n=1 Tax=Xanthomonas arboricola TaxID=56448 RepID=UPI000CEDFCA7|nr:hypothetical protein [Xanthomonas arboricola]PPU04879.1 hypothetical protein XacyCFBP2565_22190 [Xanthomonas arboricola pv. corylina]
MLLKIGGTSRSNTVNEAVAEVIGVQGLELDGVDMSLAASPARRANQRRTLQSSVPTFFPD